MRQQKTTRMSLDPNEIQINNLHDKLFKETFSIVREARAFLTHFVDAELTQTLDLSTLKIDNGSYVDEELQEHFADIIYTCARKDGKEVKVCILFEHKSYDDKRLPVQLLNYMSLGYRQQTRGEGATQINPILPVVLYHGETKRRHIELKDMIGGAYAEILPYLANFKYEVIDLSKFADEMLLSVKTGVLLSKTLTVFKHSRDKGYFLENSRKILSFTERELENDEKRELILILLRYIFGAHRFDRQEIKEFTKKLNIMEQVVAGSYADVLIKEGKIEGRVEGKVVADTLKTVKFVCNLLKSSSMTDTEIANAAEVSVSHVTTMRLLLIKNTRKTAPGKILRNFFNNIKLTEQEKEVLVQSVKKYYEGSDVN